MSYNSYQPMSHQDKRAASDTFDNEPKRARNDEDMVSNWRTGAAMEDRSHGGGHGGGYGGSRGGFSGGYGGSRGGNSYGGGYTRDCNPPAPTGPPAEIKKDFYEEHPTVTNLSDAEVKAFRDEHNIKILQQAHRAPKPVREFNEINLPDYVQDMISKAGYQKPSPIQAQGWPVALSGRDMIGIAETGSGKTMAFLLPAIVHINAQPRLQRGETGPICLVLAPTRELAQQIEVEARKACGHSLRCTVLVGGTQKGPQIGALKRGCEIVIATPGRLLDLLEMNLDINFNLNRCSYLCLDEADRMLDMGFERDLRKICQKIRPDRQTLLWSATWPREVQAFARDLCQQDPVHIHVGEGELGELKGNPRITQVVEVIQRSDEEHKLRRIQEILAAEKEKFAAEGGQGGMKTVIFSMTKRGCDQLSRRLQYDRMGALAIHGDKVQADRDWSLKEFKQPHSGYDILCATDVAARGLDIKNVKVVINYDFPLNIEDYVHRIGRTGRAGAFGTAYSFFVSGDLKNSRKSAADLISILKKTSQNVPQELQAVCGSYQSNGSDFRGGKGGYRGGGKGYGKSYGKQQRSFGGGNFGRSGW